MKTLTINYLSHDRHDCLEYWEITSSIINQIKQKEYIKLNILCTNNFEYEKYISDEIEVNKYVCNSYMDKIKIISESIALAVERIPTWSPGSNALGVTIDNEFTSKLYNYTNLNKIDLWIYVKN